MLHMIVNTHHAESCAYRGEAEAATLIGAFERLEGGVAAAHDVKIQGSWINRPSHEGFILAEAPSAHAIDDALAEAGILACSHSRVLSVMATDDVEVTHDE
jgi:hypothetical protein